MTRDLEEEEVDRQKLVLQHTHGLMEALGKTIASDQVENFLSLLFC